MAWADYACHGDLHVRAKVFWRHCLKTHPEHMNASMNTKFELSDDFPMSCRPRRKVHLNHYGQVELMVRFYGATNR